MRAIVCIVTLITTYSSIARADTLLPRPAEVTVGEGALHLGPRVGVVLAGPRRGQHDARIEHAVERLHALFLQQHQVAVCVAPCAAPQRITLIWADPGAPVQQLHDDEAYELTVTPQHATISAVSSLGILRGLETLGQWMEGRGETAQLAAVHINDAPRFAWRGLLIDSARHFIPTGVLKRTIDAMASVKLNVLHWHLTDDQGFRVESRRFPELHQKGSNGEFYSHSDIRDIVAYAHDRGIRVVPEFDMPGHVQSWLVSHPELASAPSDYTVGTRWGIYDATLDPTQEATYEFIDTFLGEMAGLFPDTYVHIGGDEVTPTHWQQNPRIGAFMQQHQLADVHALQTYFINRVATLAARHGKQIAGWDEILQPGLALGTVVQSWRGKESLQKALQAGYLGILSSGYYLDANQSAGEHYQVDPADELDLPAAATEHLLGGEACQWTEMVHHSNVEASVWPRTAAIAERFWSPPEVTDVDDLYRRLVAHSDRLHALGVTHRTAQEDRLAELAGEAASAPLAELAAVLEPRHGDVAQNYDVHAPLNRLANALYPESATGRELLRSVREDVLGTPTHSITRQVLSSLVRNHVLVLPLLRQSPALNEIEPVEDDVLALAQLGLQALDYLDSKDTTPPPAAWVTQAHALLDRAAEPRASVRIAILPAVRLLVASVSGG